MRTISLWTGLFLGACLLIVWLESYVWASLIGAAFGLIGGITVYEAQKDDLRWRMEREEILNLRTWSPE